MGKKSVRQKWAEALNVLEADDQADKPVLSFREFVNKVYPRYQWYRHCQVLASVLQRVADGGMNRVMIFMPPRHGKLCADETPVLTTRGWKTHGDLRVGDFVFSPDGKPTKIIATSEKGEANIRVELTNGEVIYCHENHEWTVFDRTVGKWRTLETKHFMRTTKFGYPAQMVSSGRYIYQLPLVSAIQLEPKDLLVRPYTLGAWLGDGTAGKPCITHSASDVAVVKRIEEDGYKISSIYKHNVTGVLTTSFSGTKNRPGDMTQGLQKLGVYRDKHVPDVYKNGSIQQRLDLLAGLIDTDGHVDETGRVCVATVSDRLASDIEDVAESLGFRPYRSTKSACTSSSGMRGTKPVLSVGYQPTMLIPTALPRKHIGRLAAQRKVSIASVVRDVDSKRFGHCIQVDNSDGLYVVGRQLTATHNSQLVSKIFPGYLLYRYPDKWVGLNSYAAELSYTFSRAARDAYREIGGNMRDDAAAVKNWETPTGGGCWASGVGGPITGKGFGSCGIIDDPIKNAKEALSTVVKRGHQDWYGSTFYTRAEPDAPIVLVTTRWAEDDLAGWLLQQESEDEPENWHIVNFEAIKEETQQQFPSTCTVEPDWRSPGEALCPERFDLGKLSRIKKRLGTYFFGALYQQRPSPIEGDHFKRSWWQFYKIPPADFDEIIQSWDCAFKETNSSDFVVGQVWGRKGANFHLLDQVRDRMDINGTMTAIRTLSAKHPKSTAKLVEDKANGSAVIDLLKREIAGLIPVEPEGGKLVRAVAIAPYVQAGNVWLPDPTIAPWIHDYIEEFAVFPNGAFDDMCDSTSQALNWMQSHQSIWYEQLAAWG